MLFNDYPFLLVFLPAAVLLYRFVDPHPRWRIGVLVLLSLVFYSYWNPPFTALLVLSIVFNWLAALAYARTKQPAIVTIGSKPNSSRRFSRRSTSRTNCWKNSSARSVSNSGNGRKN